MENYSSNHRPDYRPDRYQAPRKRTIMWLIDTREISNIAFVVRSGMLQVLLTRADYDRTPEYDMYEEIDERDEEAEPQPRKPAYRSPVRAHKTQPRIAA
jgi:hypothetical protein